ncbi:MAG: porphobilinogen synthase [Nitriliruptoraceae bacterium]
MATGPTLRPRRLRRTPALRRAFAETTLPPGALVLPMFVRAGLDGSTPVPSLPGVHQHGTTSAVAVAERCVAAGIGGVMLFGIPATKDAHGTPGWDPRGPVPEALRAIRAAVGDELVLWADVCQCEYTDHGHCGPLDDDGQVDNDAAVEGYVRDAVAYAEAGADLVAPSGMMDGQVAAIRAGLDAAGHHRVGIVAYAAKFASAYYGPFRDAAGSSMLAGDRRGHQLDPANAREANRELDLDAAEGADALMVKPALAYLDIVAAARRRHELPVAAYHVSGEYAMIHAAAERGWIDGPAAMREAVTSIRRAGADLVLTYAALELAGGPEDEA